MGKKAYLVLADHTIYQGETLGATGDVVAEVVFTTGMTGYLETLTDKSYCGQIAVQTFPLIGNYGVIPEDFESDFSAPGHLRGYVVREWCAHPSNFRAQGDLDALLKARGVVGLCGIDTRALVRRIREKGVMNGMITDDPQKADFDAIAAYRVQGAVEEASTSAAYQVSGALRERRVALLDYGLKSNIVRELVKRGCEVTVFPQDATAKEVLSISPQGIMLSNGPGDPQDNVAAIATLKELTDSGVPIFGICLGHQLLALAHGCATTKLKYGHRGANQPVREAGSGRVYITSQNHGYAVVPESIHPKVATQLFTNVNDATCEGIEYRDTPAFTVQFHPEACGGPRDTAFLFDRFMDRMRA